MKRVKIVAAMAIALAVVAVAVAQDKKGEGKSRLTSTSRAFLRFERLRTAVEGLDLSAEQKEKLGKIREELGPKMKEIHDKLVESASLTEEQKNAGAEAMKQAKEAGKKGREFFESLEAAIKLTPEQKEKMAKVDSEITALYKEHAAKAMEILTPEQQTKVKEKLQAAGKKGGKRGEKKAT